MNPPSPNLLANPIIQYGFAGMCIALLLIIVWLIWIIVTMFRENQKVIKENTTAYNNLTSCINKVQSDLSNYAEALKRSEERIGRFEDMFKPMWQKILGLRCVRDKEE